MSTKPSLILTRLDVQRLERLIDSLDESTPGVLALQDELDRAEQVDAPALARDLAATLTSDPQVLFLPDGEISRFTLTLQSYDKEHHFRVVSQGAAPVSVENDG